MCSPGGWTGDRLLEPDLRYLKPDLRYLKPDLRYLKNEPPIAADLSPFDRHSIDDPYRWRDYEAATGAICGNILGASGWISFLSTLGYSPTGHAQVEAKQDGSFCSDRLGPGKYYLYFTGGVGPDHPVAAFYPGVSTQAKAMSVEVRAGQTQSGLTFKVPTETYSVQGFISTNDKSELGENSVSIMLFGPTFRAMHTQSVDFRGFFPLPKMKRFKIDNVPAGHYAAYALANTPTGQWFTRKLDIDVNAKTGYIFLELVDKN